MPKYYEYPLELQIKAQHTEPKEQYGSWSFTGELVSLSLWEPNTLQKVESGSIHANWEETPEHFQTTKVISGLGTQKLGISSRAYAVVIGCGSGDSFGSSTNSAWEAVHVFRDQSLALILAKEILLTYACRELAQELAQMKESGSSKTSKEKKAPHIVYLNDALKKEKFYTEIFEGYFSHLDHVGVYALEVRSPYLSNPAAGVEDVPIFENKNPEMYRLYDWRQDEGRAKILAQINALNIEKEQCLLQNKAPLAHVIPKPVGKNPKKAHKI